MANLNAPMPTFSTPFLRDGLVNEPWYRFLFQLQIRTGGVAGLDFATQDELDALALIVSNQGQEIDGQAVPLPTHTARLPDSPVAVMRQMGSGGVESIVQARPKQGTSGFDGIVPAPIDPYRSFGASLIPYTPTLTASIGTFTTASAIGQYYRVGNLIFVRSTITITAVGTGQFPVITLPFPFNTASGVFVLNGREEALTGKMLQAKASGTNQVTVFNYDNTNPAASGAQCFVSGVYVS